jgi:predicted dehydrogenase
MAGKVKFGILSCANIARTLINAMRLLPEVEIHALASRTLDKVQSFAAANNVPEETKLYGSYEELLDDDELDAVYIPLPTGLHVEWVLKAAAKKKHVLLEKPPAHTVKELDVMLAALHKNGLQYMDGTMWMHHPRTREMEAVLHDSFVIGRICEVKLQTLASTSTLTNGYKSLNDCSLCAGACDLQLQRRGGVQEQGRLERRRARKP